MGLSLFLITEYKKMSPDLAFHHNTIKKYFTPLDSVRVQQYLCRQHIRRMVSLVTLNTECPGSIEPLDIIRYYIKWATTSWTHSTIIQSNSLSVSPHQIFFYQSLALLISLFNGGGT